MARTGGAYARGISAFFVPAALPGTTTCDVYLDNVRMPAANLIGDFQLGQAMLADRQAALLAGWSLAQATALAYDARPPGASDSGVSMQASCTKLFTTEMVGRVADRGVQIHGGAGDMNEYKVERFYRDVRLLRLYAGTSQISSSSSSANI